MLYMVRIMLKTADRKTVFGRAFIDAQDSFSARRQAEADWAWKYPSGCRAVAAEAMQSRIMQKYLVRIQWQNASHTTWADVSVAACDAITAKEAATLRYAWKYPDLTTGSAKKDK